MKNTKEIALIFLVIVGSLFAFWYITREKWDVADDGVTYHYVQGAPSASYLYGNDDVLIMNVSYRIHSTDSILGITNSIIPTYVKPSYKGDIISGFKRMHVGDSVLFKVSALNFFKYNLGVPVIPDFIRKNDESILIGVRLLEVQKAEQHLLDIKAKAKKNETDFLVEQKNSYKSYNELEILDVKELKKGEGPRPIAGNTAFVQYSITAPDGTPVFSNFNTTEMKPIKVGTDTTVVQGFHQVLPYMQQGEKRKFLFPSSVVYGDKTVDLSNGIQIPPHTPLFFEIELLAVKP